MDKPTIVCVLGMHRSGTSLAARVVNILGVELGPGEHLIAATPANPGGYWENERITKLNGDLLDRLGGSWNRPPKLSPDWENSPELSDLRRRARRIVAEEFGDAPMWGWKDPRTCLTLPFWRKLLPPIRYVLCLRNPVDVARSLARRREDPVPFNRSLDLWLTYVRSSIAGSVGHDRMVLFYEDLMGDPDRELRRLGSFIGASRRARLGETRQAVRDFVQEEFRHQRASTVDAVDDPALPFPAKSLYLALRLWNRGGEGLDASGSLRLLDLFTDYSVEADRQFRRLRTRGQQQEEALELAERRQKELAADLEARSQTLADRDAQIGDLRGALEEEKQAGERLRADLSAREAGLRDLQVAVTHERKAHEQLRAELSAREAEVRDMRKGLAGERRMRERDRVALTQHEAKLRDLSATLADEKRTADRLSAELAAREASVGDLKATMESEKLAAEQLRADAGTHESEREALADRVRELEHDVTEAGRRVKRLRSTVEQQKKRGSELEATLEERDAEVRRLRRSVEGQQPKPEKAEATETRRDRKRARARPHRPGGRGPARAADRKQPPPETAPGDGQPAAASEQSGGADTPVSPRQQRYGRLVTRLRTVAEKHLPERATALVVSKGDEDLLRLKDREAWHFPRTAAGVYSGNHPADSMSAIAQMEALRLKGADHFIVPSTSLWWLDHYVGLRRHLERMYEVVFDDPEIGIIYRLDGAAGADAGRNIDAAMAEVVDGIWARFDRHPSILDWDSGRSLPETRPDLAAFSPPSGDSPLPYADGSVDVVVTIADSGSRIADARRVASSALVTVSPEPDGHQDARGARDTQRVTVEWLSEGRAPGTRASIIAYAGGTDTVGAIADSIPSLGPAQLLAIGESDLRSLSRRNGGTPALITLVPAGGSFAESVNRAVERTSGEILVFTVGPIVPFGDWLRYLLEVFRTHADAGAVAPKLVSAQGTLLEVGGTISPEGSWLPTGAGSPRIDAPPFNHLREVDACSPALFATTGAVFKRLHGLDTGYRTPLHTVLDYSLRVREMGRKVYCQPAAIGMKMGTEDETSEQSDEDRIRLVERHGRVIADLGSGRAALAGEER